MASNPPLQVEDFTDEDFFDKLVADDFGEGGSAAVFDSDDADTFANLCIDDSAGGAGLGAKESKNSGEVIADSSCAHAEESVAQSNSDEIGSEFAMASTASKGIGLEFAMDSTGSKGIGSEFAMDSTGSKGIGSEFAMDSTGSKNIGLEFAMDSTGSKGIGSELAMDSTAIKGIGSEVAIDYAAGNGSGSEVAMDSAANKSIGSGGSGVKEVGWGSFYADSVQNEDTAVGSYSEFFGDLGDGSGGFPEKLDVNSNGEATGIPAMEELAGDNLYNSVNYANHQEGQAYATSTDQSADGQDMNGSQYWENLYPGWKYDHSTGQWYQVEGYDVTATDAQGSMDTNSASDSNAISDGKADVSYLQTAQSITGTITETTTNEIASNWNQVSQVNGGYPEHMVFDPQYPGWYFDSIAQEWRSLEAYASSLQSTVQSHGQQNQNELFSYDTISQNNNYQEYGQADNYVSQDLGSLGQDGSWAQSYTNSNYSQQGANTWQPEPIPNRGSMNMGGTQQLESSFGSKVFSNSHGNQSTFASSFGEVPLHDKTSHFHGEMNGTAELHSFAPTGNFSHQLNQSSLKQNAQMHFSNDYHGSQESANYVQQSFQSGYQFSHDAGRSSAGRPPHALVTFGFGGKLVVMKDNSLNNSSYGSQDPVGGSISVLNLLEVVTGNTGASSCDYFQALCQQSFPGPLAGGNVGNKELYRWLDERIARCDSANMDYRKSEVLRLLLSLLKIACQHYGKLRSPFGTDNTVKEDDLPESAVAKLFASAKSNDSQFSALSPCLQNLPSEGQIQATASQVQNLLVSGRKIEALQCAKEGQLWGPALVLASQLGDQFYVDVVKQMALQQLVAGSPMRTLCLLIAGQPADVFSTDTTSGSSLPAAMSMSQQPGQFGASGMLDDWEENLAVITANRTKDDELVIIHLGDCLWKERSEILAAHICYLIAETNFESYSDSARLCLIGADHWKLPRTYASPEAIQRTELYEYSKVLGNSQYILQSFQPYKLVYAHMLAEVGKVTESLKYCQAVLKSLKTGRAPEVETWKQLVLSLEERIKAHQQGGYAVNLAPAKLVGKLLNFFDSTAHRVVGGIPPPAPSIPEGGVRSNEHGYQPMGPRASAIQSTMAMTSLVPSASMEPISERRADDNRMTAHNRSVSEPDIGRTPRQDSSTDQTATNTQGQSSGGASRLSRFGIGSQFLQKMGLLRGSDKQAKLGEKNKFYYDEKLKRWVEEGVEPPAEEAALPPPPTTAAFQNGMPDYNLKSAIRSDGSPPTGSPKFKKEHASGIPPIPPSSNQFSARGRMGVRSRYVDTFNHGGGSAANLFQPPSVPSAKPAVTANQKFFIPGPVSSSEPTLEAVPEQTREASTSPASSEHGSEKTSTSSMGYPFQSLPPTSSSSFPRFSSMDNIPRRGEMDSTSDPLSSQSRRIASWSGGSGSFNEAYSAPPKPVGVQPPGMPPQPSYMPSDPSSMRMSTNGGSFGDLHEVEL